ncbi:MAG TPA: GDSL-type esterase/lipase family protein, partial [Bradyrhizobium sp.]
TRPMTPFSPSRRTLLGLAAGLPFLAAAGRVPLAAEPISRLDTKWWRERHEAKLAELRRGPVDLVFLGDSITQNYEKSGPEPFQNFVPVWQRFYGDRHALNLGFVGDATSHLLWRIYHGEIDGIAPKAAIILIGANNLGRVHWPADDNIAGIAAVVDATRRKLPRTKILLLGILPSERSAWATETTVATNRGLAARYGNNAAPDLTYMDIGGVFMRNGAFDRDLFYDPRLSPPEPPLHPTPEGQARMAAAIEPMLAQMMGDRVHGK